MWKVLLLPVALAGCASNPPAQEPANAPLPPEPAPAPEAPLIAETAPTSGPEAPPPTDQPPADPTSHPSRNGESCEGGKTCNPPSRCINVVGMRPDSARKECWVLCVDDKCPAGMTCTMIYDGPGRVCVNAHE